MNSPSPIKRSLIKLLSLKNMPNEEPDPARLLLAACYWTSLPVPVSLHSIANFFGWYRIIDPTARRPLTALRRSAQRSRPFFAPRSHGGDARPRTRPPRPAQGHF